MTHGISKNKLLEEIEELKKRIEALPEDKLPTANIIVAGHTGVGKSTLINSLLGSETTFTGSGYFGTDHIQEYHGKDIPINIWDTVGFELGDTRNTIKSIKEIIASKAFGDNPFDMIHAIWYCIHSASERYMEIDVNFIREFNALGIPIIIVLTCCVSETSEFEEAIKNRNISWGGNIRVVRTLAENVRLRNGIVIPSFGLNELIENTLEQLPRFMRDVISFIYMRRKWKGEN